MQHSEPQRGQREYCDQQGGLPDSDQHMDRAVLDTENDEQSHKSGRQVPDPLRDHEAGCVGLFDQCDEGLYFGAGDQKRVAEYQGDYDQLRKITLDKG